MGNLFSRAIKRFTQCSSSRNQLQNQAEQQEPTGASQLARQQRDARTTVQSIPVGQSIDSAEYAAIDSARGGAKGSNESSEHHGSRAATAGAAAVVAASASKQTILEEDESQEESGPAEKRDNDKENDTQKGYEEPAADQSKPAAVEEAVIKIQALVRGHLTRKALKDAQQQAATPAPNALGQSQFDEESLTKNPPSALFSHSTSPLNTTNLSSSNNNNDPLSDQMGRLIGTSPSGARVPPLESIAEGVEGTAAGATGAPAPTATLDSRPAARDLPQQSSSTQEQQQAQQQRPRKLAPGDSSISRTFSEANASIDLNCATPASASIDILDHNIRPTDPIASVLHHKTPSPRMVVEAPAESLEVESVESVQHNQAASLSPEGSANTTMAANHEHSNSNNSHSAEAAAIRIQSAFRGYHTRKHSPYRRRSPGSAGAVSASAPLSLDSALSNGHGAPTARRSPLRQQNATVALDDLDDLEAELERGADLSERRAADLEASAGLEERLSRVQAPVRRPSRQRQRPDESDDSQPSQQQQAAALASATTSSALDQGPAQADNGRVSPPTSWAPLNQLSTSLLAAGLAKVSEAGSQAHPEPKEEEEEGEPARGHNLSLELDTESSNLGAALSLNEDLSESEPSSAQQTERRKAAPERAGSIGEPGASLVADEQLSSSEGQRFIEQLIEEHEQAKNKEAEKDHNHNGDDDDDELEEATELLEAALEEALEDQVAEGLASAILDEEEQRTIELESDDIERRDPSGRASEDRSRSPLIRAGGEQQPALVSGGASFEGEEVERPQGHEAERRAQRLGVESPDEAIGSGCSSPGLISSNGNSGSSDEAGDDESAERKPASAQQQSGQAQAQQAAANKNKKKSRNRKKGRK